MDVDVLVVLEREPDPIRDEQAEDDDAKVEARLPLAAEALVPFRRRSLLVSRSFGGWGSLLVGLLLQRAPSLGGRAARERREWPRHEPGLARRHERATAVQPEGGARSFQRECAEARPMEIAVLAR
jgi:hypothetical protein